jgi:hypothetical protein
LWGDLQAITMNMNNNVGLLMQRAYLYESVENFQLSMKDFEAVLQLDHSHHMAKICLNRIRENYTT